MATRKLIPQEVQRQIDGLKAATAHANVLFNRGIISREELEAVNTYALQQKFEKFMAVDEYIEARQNGNWDAYEQLMNDARTPSGEARELAVRKVAAAYVAEQALNEQLPKAQTQEEHNAILRDAREHMSKFIDMTGEDADNDVAVYESHAKITLGDGVRKPVEEPSWAKPLQRLSDDDPDVKAFKLRDENTVGTKRYNAATDSYGEKRDSKGRYIPKNVLREDADKIPARKNSTFEEDAKRVKETGADRGDGMTLDREYGVRTAGEAAEIERYEQGQRNDAAAAAEAAPPPPSDAGPVTLPNPHEA